MSPKHASGERGAIIIHVAIAIMALLAITAFVIDQGVMLAARRQAQNAADAGALAGAVTLTNNLTDYAEADAAAKHFAGTQNGIWGQATAPADVRVWPLPHPCPPGSGGGNACIRVDVFRGINDPNTGQGHANVLPTYFAHLVGLTSQGVRATATAQVAAGNSVNCIKPWIVVDRWTDNTGDGADPNGWDQLDRFTPGVDTYTPPGFTASGPNNDIGLQLMLKGDDGLDPGGEWSAGWSMRIELGGGNGAATYMDEIQGCPSWVPEVGIYDGSVACNTRADQNFPKGCINVRPGVSQGPTVKHGVDHLIDLDPDATWDIANKKIVGGCTDSEEGCSTVNPEGNDYSPRIIPLALFNPQRCVTTGCSSGNNTVAEVVNIMGFFLEGTCDDVYPAPQKPPAWCGSHPDKTVVGRIMNYPGQASSATGSAGPWSFIRVIRLVR